MRSRHSAHSNVTDDTPRNRHTQNMHPYAARDLAHSAHTLCLLSNHDSKTAFSSDIKINQQALCIHKNTDWSLAGTHKWLGMIFTVMPYKILLKTLDCLCSEAPPEFTSMHPDPKDTEKLNLARSKAFIHLFLKLKCGISIFKERHSYITDGTHDGGIDAYFIDKENKKLLLIQSKFRTTNDNFTAKSLTADDLVKIEVNRILKGERIDGAGKEYNDKIKQLQKEWSEIGDQAKYDYNVIILGNLKKYTEEQVKRLLDNSKYEVFDFERTYNELVFPLCCGTYYDPKEIRITINLYNKEQSTLKQTITTKYGDYDVRITFVPAEEVAKMMLKYKNSLLKYNPRNYLTLAQNKINQQIRKSIVEGDSNEFAVFNNGITILADNFSITETTGRKFKGQLILSQPQIINGGQTAYTLAKIFEEYEPLGKAEQIFRDKEVLFKIIVIRPENKPEIEFIEKISDATNKQTNVEEADRRSNLSIQVKIQKSLYNDYGFLYERKKGEFYHGIQSGYVNPNYIIDRNEFVRAYFAFKGNPRWARQKGKEVLFRMDYFTRIIDSPSNYRKMLFSWILLRFLHFIEYDRGRGAWRELTEFAKDYDFGSSLRYGKMAVVAAVGAASILTEKELSKDIVISTVQKTLSSVFAKWKAFEDWAKAKAENKDFLLDTGFDFDFYYKGRTVDSDIAEFFKLAPQPV